MKISRNLTADTQHPREDLWLSGSIAALNSELILDADSCTTVTVRTTGTFSATLILEGLTDAATWDLIPIRNPVAGGAYAISITGIGTYVANCASYRKVRVRCSSYTSGSINTYISCSNAILDQSLQGTVTPLIVTGTAAAGAALTLILPAPAAGLRSYLTHIRIVKFAAAALTAAAAPVIVTTTNLPGSLAFSLPADAAAQGTVYSYQEDFSYPIVSSAQATATTIVMPITTGVLWRATAGYYVAP